MIVSAQFSSCLPPDRVAKFSSRRSAFWFYRSGRSKPDDHQFKRVHLGSLAIHIARSLFIVILLANLTLLLPLWPIDNLTLQLAEKEASCLKQRAAIYVNWPIARWYVVFPIFCHVIICSAF